MSPEQLAETLAAAIPHLSEDDRDFIAERMEAQSHEPGTQLTTHGEGTDSIYLLAGGEVEISLRAGDTVVELGRRGPQSWIGEMGMLEPGPASADVRVTKPLDVCVLTHAQFNQLRAERPLAAACMMEAVARDMTSRLRLWRAVHIESVGPHLKRVRPQVEPGLVKRFFQPLAAVFASRADAEEEGPVEAGERPEGMDLATFIERHASFRGLTAEDRAHLAQACEEREYRAGHAFITEGQAPDAVYFLLDGRVRVRARGDSDDEASFAVDRIMGPGEIIGLIALIDRGPRSATVSTIEPSRVAVLHLEAARLLMDTRAPISCSFQCGLSTQLVHDARQLNEAILEAAMLEDGQP